MQFDEGENKYRFVNTDVHKNAVRVKCELNFRSGNKPNSAAKYQT